MVRFSKWLLLIVLLSAAAVSQAQLVPVSLEQRIENSDVVFEGKVIGKTSSWDKDRRHIYTSNLISVYKVFKGELKSSTVEVITIGGTVGNEREDVSYGLKLDEGSVGVFTCNPNTVKLNHASSNVRLNAYSEIQGFIRYDLKTGSAKDVFRVYRNISKDVYPQVQNVTHSKYKVLKKADF